MIWKKKTIWNVAYSCKQGHISGIDDTAPIRSWQPDICPECGESGQTLQRISVKREYEETRNVFIYIFSWPIRNVKIIEIRK